MKHKWIARLSAAVLAAALLAGCGGGSVNGGNYATADAVMPDSSSMYYESSNDYGALESGLQPKLDTDRKIIYTANLRLETTDFEQSREALMEAVDAADAYISSTDLSGSANDGDRRLYYTVRVPVEHYTSFLADAGGAGNVLSLSESMDDITTSYIDVQARLDSLENQRDRLNALAAQAETTADLLEIESQLSDVQYQIESMTRQLRSMDDQVSYSTVDIMLREVTYLTPVTHTFLDRLIDAFFSGWRNFGDFIEDFVIAVVYMLPMLILIAVIVLIVRKVTAKSRAERKAAREAMRQARLDAKAARQGAQSPTQEENQGPKY